MGICICLLGFPLIVTKAAFTLDLTEFVDHDDQSERKPTYSIFPPPDDIIPKSGVLYKAAYASREKGEKLAKQVVGTIVQIGRQELGW